MRPKIAFARFIDGYCDELTLVDFPFFQPRDRNYTILHLSRMMHTRTAPFFAFLLVVCAPTSSQRASQSDADGSASRMIEQLSTAGRSVVAISFGSPYLVSAYPSVPAYLLAWGGAPVSQRAAAAALLRRIAIGGKLPISIPPWFKTGDGIDRAASATTSGT